MRLRSEIVFPRASAIGYHRFYVIGQSAETVRRELTDVERGTATRGEWGEVLDHGESRHAGDDTVLRSDRKSSFGARSDDVTIVT